jgi:hypothetical protein
MTTDDGAMLRAPRGHENSHKNSENYLSKDLHLTVRVKMSPAFTCSGKRCPRFLDAIKKRVDGCNRGVKIAPIGACGDNRYLSRYTTGTGTCLERQ